jgi:hypothetical protein
MLQLNGRLLPPVLVSCQGQQFLSNDAHVVMEMASRGVRDPDCAVKQEVMLEEVAPKTACCISVSFLGPGLGVGHVLPRLDMQFAATRPFDVSY